LCPSVFKSKQNKPGCYLYLPGCTLNLHVKWCMSLLHLSWFTYSYYKYFPRSNKAFWCKYFLPELWHTRDTYCLSKIDKYWKQFFISLNINQDLAVMSQIIVFL